MKQLKKSMLFVVTVGMTPFLVVIVGWLFFSGDEEEQLQQSAAAARVTEFLEAMRDDRYEAAWELLDPSYRKTTTPEQLRQAVRATSELHGFGSFLVREYQPLEEPPRVQAQLYVNGKRVEFQFRMSRVDSHWFVAGITVDGRSVLPPGPNPGC